MSDMERDEYGIPIIRCHSAEQMMSELNEIHSRWKDGTWIFRGQNFAHWKLVPSAMRPEFWNDLVSCYPRAFSEELINNLALTMDKSFDEADRMNTTYLQNQAELELVATFEILADRVGLTVPNDRYVYMGQSVRDPVNKLRDYFEERDLTPPEEAPSDVVMYQPTSLLVALAQHHRIPTRLLDWTHRSYNAAFFAAHGRPPADALKKCPEMAKYVVVWAVKIERLAVTSLQPVTHPGRRNQIGFLFAQEGAFLFDATANGKYMTEGSWQPFESELHHIAAENAVYKLILHASHTKRLLQLLERKGITKARLMPSFDNVAELSLALGLDEIDQILNVEYPNRF